MLLCCSLFMWIACEKDGDMICVSNLDESKLIASRNTIALSMEQSSVVVLSLAWNHQALTLSNPEVGLPDILSTSLVVSLSEDLAGAQESVVESESKAYTGSELNTLAKNLGMQPDTPTKIYFSLKSSLGPNMTPVYSNTVAASVTSYHIDMTVGFILDKDKADTGFTLYSPESNGIYSGFIGAVAWYNFYLKEGDATLWGNVGQDGAEFQMTKDDTMWNYWYPGMGGCYYTEMNTGTQLWSALYIPSLQVSGSITGEMTYDRANNRWILPFTSADAEATVTISGTGSQYDYDSGTNDEAASDKTIGFSSSGDGVVFGSSASEIRLSLPGGGEYTLVLDLGDPKQFTCTVTSGSEEPDVITPYLWISGIDDLISGGWTFDNYLVLYDELKLGYAGVVNAASEWGYQFYTEKDNWGTAIGLDEGSAASGTLKAGGDNVPAPEAGLWLTVVSLSEMTYALTSVEGVSYSGLNNDWSLSPLNETSEPGVYSALVTLDTASDWGFKIYLNGSWDYFFGGNGGNLYYLGSGITDDAALAPGNYMLTVDLVKGTYSLQ